MNANKTLIWMSILSIAFALAVELGSMSAAGQTPSTSDVPAASHPVRASRGASE